MTDHELERHLRDWYATEIGTTEPAPPSLYHSLVGIPEAVPLQPRPMPMRRRVLLLAAAALVATLVAGTVAVGSGLVKLPVPRLPAPLPTQSVSPSVQASPAASPQPPDGVVAYPVCTNPEICRIWVANADGTGAHELLPDEPGDLYPLAWSADGSRLLYRFDWSGLNPGEGEAGLALTDAAGSEPVEHESLCPTDADDCQANVDAVSISPDGTRLAYSVAEGSDLEISTIVILDVASRQVTRLDSTRTQNPGSGPGETLIEEPCTSDASQGYNELPSWSPDGARLVFARQAIGPRVNGFCQSTIFTVNVDGTDLQRLVPPDVPAVFPRWSPDGSSISFHAATPDTIGDIYTIRPDSTDLQALTRGGGSVWPHWTRDGRIVFIRELTPDGRGELWIMDADGGIAAQLDATVPALTAVDCLVCPYPNEQGQYWSENRLNRRLWQPLPAGQP